MNKTSIIILAIFFLLGLISAFLPNIQPHLKTLDGHQLLYRLNQNHYVSTDELAKSLMNKEPYVLLVDVRDTAQYHKFTLPSALNIPADSILNPKYQGYFRSGAYKVILFSNGTQLAEKAWIMLAALGYENIFVLDGGINNWFQTIINPKKPNDWEKQHQFDLYQFRKVASMYFTGAKIESSEVESSSPSANLPVQTIQSNESEVSGGCE